MKLGPVPGKEFERCDSTGVSRWKSCNFDLVRLCLLSVWLWRVSFTIDGGNSRCCWGCSHSRKQGCRVPIQIDLGFGARCAFPTACLRTLEAPPWSCYVDVWRPIWYLIMIVTHILEDIPGLTSGCDDPWLFVCHCGFSRSSPIKQVMPCVDQAYALHGTLSISKTFRAVHGC